MTGPNYILDCCTQLLALLDALLTFCRPSVGGWILELARLKSFQHLPPCEFPPSPLSLPSPSHPSHPHPHQTTLTRSALVSALTLTDDKTEKGRAVHIHYVSVRSAWHARTEPTPPSVLSSPAGRHVERSIFTVLPVSFVSRSPAPHNKQAGAYLPYLQEGPRRRERS